MHLFTKYIKSFFNTRFEVNVRTLTIITLWDMKQYICCCGDGRMRRTGCRKCRRNRTDNHEGRAGIGPDFQKILPDILEYTVNCVGRKAVHSEDNLRHCSQCRRGRRGDMTGSLLLQKGNDLQCTKVKLYIRYTHTKHMNEISYNQFYNMNKCTMCTPSCLFLFHVSLILIQSKIIFHFSYTTS